MRAIQIRRSAALSGSAEVSGSKNAALPAIAAAALARCRVVLENVPDIEDVGELCVGLGHLGVATRRDAGALIVEPAPGSATGLPPSWGVRFRASIYGLAASAIMTGRASVRKVGGDRLLGRDLQIHARAFRAHGFEVKESGAGLGISGALRAAEYRLDDRPGGITASATALLLAASCHGRSVVRGLSREPEVVALGALLQMLGAQLAWDGTACLVQGPLQSSGAHWAVEPDRLVWGTLAIAALVTGGEISLADIPHLDAICGCLEAAGASIEHCPSARIELRADRLKAFDLATGPYPCLSSDLVPPFTVLMAACPGSSTVEEKIYPDRFAHMPQLARMGLRYEQDGARLRVAGGTRLRGRSLSGGGIRETAALLLATLVADGESHIRPADDIWRGYADLPRDLERLGADLIVHREREGLLQ